MSGTQNFGPAYGLSASVARKIMSKRDPAAEQNALAWICTILGEPIPPRPLEDHLRDGQVLCRFMNQLAPGIIPKINRGPGVFQLMENIQNFNGACTQLGLNVVDLFQTIDLWEKRNIAQVLTTLQALGSRLQVLRPDLPAFGPRPAQENRRDFSEEQLREGEAIIGLQAGAFKGANQSGMNFGNTRHM